MKVRVLDLDFHETRSRFLPLSPRERRMLEKLPCSHAAIVGPHVQLSMGSLVRAAETIGVRLHVLVHQRTAAGQRLRSVLGIAPLDQRPPRTHGAL